MAPFINLVVLLNLSIFNLIIPCISGEIVSNHHFIDCKPAVLILHNFMLLLFHILRHLKGAPSNPSLNINGYADVDWESCVDT